jgi:hypothetical protein
VWFFVLHYALQYLYYKCFDIDLDFFPNEIRGLCRNALGVIEDEQMEEE